MPERASPLEGHDAPRRFGPTGPDGPGVRLSERRLASVWLIAAWPDRLAAAGAAAAKAAGVEAAPGPGASATGEGGTLMRVEPLKWLLIGEAETARPGLDPADGTVLELGHARTVLHVAGPRAVELMARLVPLDLRPAKFPEGAVAGTVLHHVGVTILARDGGFDLLVLRSFGLAVWETLIDTAAQFGAEIA
ncbi:MAG TPA: sarcosine oxidase subunit gamma family protein [Thermohalobaculum sp.]|nr:sarcosine oxidase subunit gamma family protein [Thermohalobaculum sp.]